MCDFKQSVAHLLNKSDSTEISAATRIHALKSELEAVCALYFAFWDHIIDYLCIVHLQKLAESSKACVAVKHDIESLASQTQTQHDRLKACFDECIKSIGTCNASITAQCSATESSSTATLSQLKKQVKDTEVATQRQIDALTHAVHALAGTLCCVVNLNLDFMLFYVILCCDDIGVLHITPMSSK